jgi:hypothetical protein
MAQKKFVVVENAGMVGEREVDSFQYGTDARRYIHRQYSERERDSLSGECKWVDVRMDWTDAEGEHQEYGCA